MVKLVAAFLFSLIMFECAPQRGGFDEPVSGVGFQKVFRETYAAHRDYFLFQDEITGHAVKSLSELDDPTIAMLIADPFYRDLVALISQADNPLTPGLPDNAQKYPRVTALLILGTSYRSLPVEQRPAPGADLIEPILELADFEIRSREDLRYSLVIPKYWPAVAARAAYEIYRARVLVILGSDLQPQNGLDLAGDEAGPASSSFWGSLGDAVGWVSDRATDLGFRAGAMVSSSVDVVDRARELKAALEAIGSIQNFAEGEHQAPFNLNQKPKDIKIGDNYLRVVNPNGYAELLKHFPEDESVITSLQVLVRKDLGDVEVNRVLAAYLRAEPDDLLRLFSGEGAAAFVRLLGAVGDLSGKGGFLAANLGSVLGWFSSSGKFHQELVKDLSALQEVLARSPGKLEKAFAALGKLGDENFVANLQAGLSERDAERLISALRSFRDMAPEVFDVVSVVLRKALEIDPESLVITRNVFFGELDPSQFSKISAEDVRKVIRASRDGHAQIRSVKEALRNLEAVAGLEVLPAEKYLSQKLEDLLGRPRTSISDTELEQWKTHFSAFSDMGDQARLLADGRPILQTFLDRVPRMARFAIGLGAKIPPELVRLVADPARSEAAAIRLRSELGRYIDDMQGRGLHELVQNVDEVNAARPYLELGLISSDIEKMLKGTGGSSDAVRSLAFHRAGITEPAQKDALARQLQGTENHQAAALATLRDRLRRSELVSSSLLRDVGLQRIPSEASSLPTTVGSVRRHSLVAYSLVAAFGAGVTIIAHEKSQSASKGLSLTSDDWWTPLEDFLRKKAAVN